jgi:hypothetical protein
MAFRERDESRDSTRDWLWWEKTYLSLLFYCITVVLDLSLDSGVGNLFNGVR